MKPTRRTFLAGLSVMAVAPALASCGGEASPSTSAPDAGASDVPVEEAAFPATIKHKFGETTITEVPRRVVCVGLTEQDALLALGVVPVGVTYWYGDETLGGINSWAIEAIGDAERPELLMDTDGIELEKIAALAPDLIIGQYTGLSQKDYDLLSQLAPTVAQPDGYPDFAVPWEEGTLNIGTAVGKPQAAQELVDSVLARIEQEAAAHPEFVGKTAAVITPFEGLFIYGPEDPRARILEQLGFEFPDILSDIGGDEFGASLSAERTSDLDEVDVAVWLGLTTDKAVQSVFETTTTFAEGRWVDIDDAVTPDYGVAHSFVTPLSIPYVLDRYVPQLAAAVDGDPGTEVPVAED